MASPRTRAARPGSGRSALDGVMLMDAGVNYMREHVPPDTRIHSVVTSGGQAPNVVPAFAQVWYFLRAPRRAQVEEMFQWMGDIARGAALMSGTRHEIEFITGCYELLPNNALSDLLYEKMAAVDDMSFTDQEREFGKALQATFPEGAVQRGYDWLQLSSSAALDPARAGRPALGRRLSAFADAAADGRLDRSRRCQLDRGHRADLNHLLAAGARPGIAGRQSLLPDPASAPKA